MFFCLLFHTSSEFLHRPLHPLRLHQTRNRGLQNPRYGVTPSATRLGEAGTDAFTIMRLARHSSDKTAQRYAHPMGEKIELAFDRLETLNQKALEASSGSEKLGSWIQCFCLQKMRLISRSF